MAADPLEAVLRRLGDLPGGGSHAASLREQFADEPETARAARATLAQLCLELRLDAPAVTAALLSGHDAPPPDDQLRDRVGEEVVELVRSVRRLHRIRWDRLEEEAAEKLRKLFLAMASDVRVVLIILAQRLQAMRAVRELPPEDRQRLASETMEIFAPLANRLGIWQLKWELEDLAFRVQAPDTYAEIRSLIAEKRTGRTSYVDEVVDLLQDHLQGAGIQARVYGRPKHIYSIYKKMKRKHVGFDEIYDALAVRVIVEEVSACYAALGLVHGLWEPIDGEFDDYIAKPKDNFYRSLHTAVIGPEGRALEIQIRTREMHEFAEYGVAAHWRYKEGGGRARSFDAKVNWLRQLIEWQKEVADPRDLAESLKTDVFQDQVYVFTPGGDVVDLPEGATPIDFAYRIHTQVGHRCRGAKVRGQIVALDTVLETGDRVEILTTKHGGPSRDWLNPHAGYVKTASARQKIRQYFRSQEREQAIRSGRELVERELRRAGLDGITPEAAAAGLGHEKPEDLFAAVGFGDRSPQKVAERILEVEGKVPAEVPRSPAGPTRRKSATGVSIAGIDDVLSQPARCCNPVPGDAVVGYITRGRGTTLHRRDCPNMRNPPEPERLVDVQWEAALGERYPVNVHIVAHDRAGLLRDVTEVIATEGINVRSIEVAVEDAQAHIDAAIDVRSSEQAMRVINKLGRLPYVQRASRRG